MTEEVETKRRGPGRPKGSKNKATIEKLRKEKLDKEEFRPDDIIEESSDIVIPDERPSDIIASLLDQDGELVDADYKTEPSLPRLGKFYVIKIREPDNRSRILMSHLDFNDSFPLSTRKIMTPLGLANGLACPVVMRFVDVITDPETEEPIGVYHVISTPSMVRTGVDPRRIAAQLTKKEIDDDLSEYTRHKALSYKMQRDLWRKDAETYKANYQELAAKRMEISQEIAATAIEMLVNAIMASKEMFDEIRKKNMPWYKRYQTEILVMLGLGALLYLLSGGTGG